MLPGWAFIEACGKEVERGATIIEPNEAVAFRCIIRHATQVIIVAYSHRITLVSPALICPVTGIDILITDSRITADTLSGFQANCVQVNSV
jgi:DeoR/GlpR family transcriptional regulator of sugar metabolism